MIIDVKGTKTSHDNRDPAQTFALQNEDRRSVVPQALALAFVGIGLYLKSIFPSLAKAGPDAGQPWSDNVPVAPVADKSAGLAGGDANASEPKAAQVKAGAAGDIAPVTLKVPPLIRLAKDTGRMPTEGPVIVHASFGNPVDPFAMQNMTVTERFVANLPSTPKAADHPAHRWTADPRKPSVAPEGPRDRSTTNRTPRVDGPVYLQDVIGLSVLLIALPDLLRSATDPDGDRLWVKNLSVSSGTLTAESGYWTYQPTGQFSEDVIISYTITDGAFEIAQTAHLKAVRPMFTGTDHDDLLVGSVWADDIIGGAGDDNIDGRGGDDVIYGGDGDDHILGGDGNDTIFGGRGNDILLGQNGNDILFGGDGDDILYGGDGDDFLDGGAGDDLLSDGAGSDVVFGGTGNDTVFAASDSADDWFFGGDGFDTLDYSLTSQGIVIDTSLGIASGGEIGNDTFAEFEHVVGGTGNDHFIAGAAPVTMTGGGGQNTFEFVEPHAANNPGLVMHEIMDFKYGDKIKMSHFKLFDKIYDKFEDEFEALYGDVDSDNIAIRLRHDTFEDMRQTIIEADLNADNIFETTVYVNGHHALVIVDMQA